MVRIINTKTKEDFIDLMEYLEANEYTWNNLLESLPSSMQIWDVKKENTCIFLTSDRRLMFDEEFFYRENYPNITIETWKIAPWPMEPSEIEKQADNLGVNTYDEALEKHIKLRNDIFKLVHNLRLNKRWNSVLDKAEEFRLDDVVARLEIILKENE